MKAKDKNRFNNPLEALINGISNLSRKREKSGTLHPEDRLDGKRILISGASSGLGLATAKLLAARGAEVIMAVRSGIPEKGEEVKRYAGSEKVKMHAVDLSDFNSVQALAETISTTYGTIDILVENAGMVAGRGRKCKQGYEEMFTVNYLAKFLLIRLLIEKNCFRTVANRIPRIIIISSESHRDPKAFRWDDFGKFTDFRMKKSVELYGYNKLLLTTFSVELSRRLNPGEEVSYSVFALCPGPVNSNIGREAPVLLMPLLKLVFALFFRSPKVAAEPVIYFAASPEMEGRAYDYFFLMSRKAVDEKAADPENGEKLWKMTETLFAKQGIGSVK